MTNCTLSKAKGMDFTMIKNKFIKKGISFPISASIKGTKTTIRRFFTLLLAFVIALGATPIMASAADITGFPVTGTYSTGNSANGNGVHWASYPNMTFGNTTGTTDATVTIDPSSVFQQFDGLGFSLEETSIHNLWQLSKEVREQLLTTIVKDFKVDIFRLVIGSCDCNFRFPFWSNDSRSFNKTNERQYDLDVEDDFDLKYFSIQMDKDLHVIDTIQFIRDLNPNAKFFASAWSPPSWMKEIRYMTPGTKDYCDFQRNPDGSYKVMLNDDGTPVRRYKGWIMQNTYTLPSGASNTRPEQMNYLRDDCINALADYYLKYVLAYKELGIDIYALTILNEPGADVCYSAMNMTIEQHQLLGRAIKQRLKANGLPTQLWAHDWNLNDWYSQKTDAGRTINDPTEDNHYRVFQDSAVATAAEMLQTYDGVALHPYDGGANRIPTQVKPYSGNLKIHNTETNQFTGANLVDWFNNGLSTYCMWVSFPDSAGGTHYWYQNSAKVNNVYDNPTGQSGWTNHAATIYLTGTNRGTAVISDNFWKWGQFSKYLVAGSDRPGDVGAKRIGCTVSGNSNVTGVAFKNPNGENVVIVNNSNTSTARTVRVAVGGASFTQTLPANSLSTFVWNPDAIYLTDGGSKIFANNGMTGTDSATDVYVQNAQAGTDYYYTFNNMPSVDIVYTGVGGKPVSSFFDGMLTSGASLTNVGFGTKLAVNANGDMIIPVPAPSIWTSPSYKLTVTAKPPEGPPHVEWTHTFNYFYGVTADFNAVTAKFINYNANKAYSGNLILAVYNDENRLVAVDAKPFSANALATVSVSFGIDTKAYPTSEYRYAVYCWDGAMVPMGPVLGN